MSEELIELEKLRHHNKMLEIKAETDGKREIEELRYKLQLELQQLKTEQIKKTIERKAKVDLNRRKNEPYKPI